MGGRTYAEGRYHGGIGTVRHGIRSSGQWKEVWERGRVLLRYQSLKARGAFGNCGVSLRLVLYSPECHYW